MHIIKGMIVKVISGNHKGQSGKVLNVFPKKMKARDFEEAYDLFYDYTASNSDEEKEPIAKGAKIYKFKSVKKIHMEA